MQYDSLDKSSSSKFMETVDLRLARPTDLHSIQRLSRECFPISYPEDLFIDLINQPKYLTILATRSDALIGMIIVEYRMINHCKLADRTILSRSLSSESVVAYILSLGVTAAFRKHGVASLLINIIMQHAQRQGLGVSNSNSEAPIPQPTNHENHCFIKTLNNSNYCQPTPTYQKLTLQHTTFLESLRIYSPRWPCRAIYLHALRSNTEALRFYEHQGFHIHRVIPACYLIDGEDADGFAFVLHLNGGRPQISLINTAIAWLHWFRENGHAMTTQAVSAVCGMLQIGCRMVSSACTKFLGHENCSPPRKKMKFSSSSSSASSSSEGQQIKQEMVVRLNLGDEKNPLLSADTLSHHN